MPDGSSPGERWAHHSSRSEIFASEKRESRREKASFAPSLAWRDPAMVDEGEEELREAARNAPLGPLTLCQMRALDRGDEV